MSPMPGSGALSRLTTVRPARPIYWMVLAAFMLGALALRVWVLRTALAPGDLTLQVDEAQYWLWSRDLHWGYYSKPPVIAAMIAWSTAWFGNNLLGVKLLAMALYPVTALVLAELARRMAWSVWPPVMSVEPSRAAGRWAERVGLFAAALFLTSPLAGLLGLAVTTDAPLLLLWACAAFLLWEALHRGRRRTWLLLGVVWGVGVLSKYTMLAFMTAVLPLVLTDGPGTRWLGWPGRPGGVSPSVIRDRVLGLMMTGGVMLLVLLPHLAWNADHGWPTLTHTVEITADAHRTDGRGGWASVGEFVGGQWVQFGPLWLMVTVVAVVSVWRQRRYLPAPLSVSATTTSMGERWTRAMRFVFWLSAPLLAVGVLQAWNAKAQINWTAPVAHGLFLFGALWLGRLVGGEPLSAREVRHARITGVWWVAVACVMWLHLVLVTAVPLAAPIAHIFGRPSEQPLPRSLDIWVRMRGWGPAYEQLAPIARAHLQRWPQAQILGMDRQVISMGAYGWRNLEPSPPPSGVPVFWQRWVAWMPPEQRAPQDHFQLTTRWARPGTEAASQPMLILSADDLPAALLDRIEPPELIGDVTLPEGADRTLHLRMWSARARAAAVGSGP